ncbi:MAG TPA: DUF2993 domain-containing protein [Chthonomonadaceae bacterium]|nr:DUF2993 domain-containing protein [Chthonomonadaceae bacterium]
MLSSKVARNAVALLLILLLGLTGCERTINRSAERRIRDALPDLIGPARSYNVHVSGAAERTVQGHLANVTVDGDDVDLPNSLLLDRLHLDLKDVEVDTGHRRIRSIGDVRFAATLGETSLDEFLAGESPEGEPIRNTRVHIEGNGSVTIAADRVVLGAGVPFRLTGPLRIVGPQSVEIDPTRLTVVGIPISGLPLRFLKQRFESAIDLSSLPFPVRLTGVQTQPGKLILSGAADVTAMLERAQTAPRRP